MAYHQRLSCTSWLFVLAVISVNGQFRVEYDLRRLDDKAGILANGEKCDTFSDCDPRITGYLDLDNPLAPWPGSRPLEQWTKILERDNDNTPVINKIVSRDSCSSSSQPRANLRLNVVDVDDLTKNDLMEQFECVVSTTDNVSAEKSFALWSPEKQCDAKFHPTSITLTYRYRVFRIPTTQCGKAPAGAETTPQSG